MIFFPVVYVLFNFRAGYSNTRVEIIIQCIADHPSAADIARDGFDKKEGLSWDDIQKASNDVQPRMFGKQGECIQITLVVLMLKATAG